MFFLRHYTLNHCRHVMHQAASHYRKEGSKLTPSLREDLKNKILSLEVAIEQKDRVKADNLTKELEGFVKQYLPKSWLKWGFELVFALAFALVVAVVVRQMWFELYEIPTGSMRPTFMEQDHLTVSKTQFGINVPLETTHFYFNPKLVQRTSTIIFSGDGLPLNDTDTTFLGVFPYKKRYVKRLIGKPGDIFAFYGGKLYAKNSKGEAIDVLRTAPWMLPLEHIPFMSFDGQPKSIDKQTIVFTYFNTPLGKVSVDSLGIWHGEVYDGTKWVADDLSSELAPHSSIQSLSDLIGMKNYAMGQLYTKEQLDKEKLKSDEEGVLYLVLRHTPHLDFSKGAKNSPRFFKVLTTVIPLQKEDLEMLKKHLYTARFVVKNGKASRYSHESSTAGPHSPTLEGVPDGTYEFYYGKGYEVHLGGITTELPEEHPLYKLTPERTQLLYNLGIGWHTAFQPGSQYQAWPYRYVYFRDGDLYTMGGKIMDKENAHLHKFIESEKKHQEEAAKNDPYIAFIDHESPLKSDTNVFDVFGLHIPDKSYLALGDNHAMSADSRIFGFVPEANLQGAPEIIIWPLGKRLGYPSQRPYPTFVFPRLIVWAVALLIGIISYSIYCSRLRRKVQL